MQKKEDGTIVTTATVFNKTTEKSETIEVTPFVSEVARVSVEHGQLVDIGNFENIRVYVRVEVPCYPEEVESIIPRISAIAEKAKDTEIDRIASLILANKRGR